MNNELNHELINELKSYETEDFKEYNEGEPAPQYRDSTYEIVSKIAYLIGVPKRIFENENQPPQMAVYEKLDRNKNARIIRHLCVIRTAIERCYKHINNRMNFEYRSFLTMPEYVPQESIKQLNEDGIVFYRKSNTRLNQHTIEINRIICDRINNCKSLFPLWINWQYIRDLFIMPNGLTDDGIKAAAATYYANMGCYPYKLYINWTPTESGNILLNDKKFATLLYEWHHSTFTEYSKVSDVGTHIKGTIYDYIEESNKVSIVVDCENSDPYKLCATLRNLDDQYMRKISSIIVFDDVHTASTWRILDQFTNIPVEHMMIDRVKEEKSLVDAALITRTCQEYYKNNVDSFILVSSDSDYWGMISNLSDARFLLMVEHEKCSHKLKSTLAKAGIFYCFIDDFYSGNAEDVKEGALFKEMYKFIDNNVHLNVNDMFEAALTATRINMTPSEKKQFFDKHIKTMQMKIDSNGDVVLEFKHRGHTAV